MSAPDTFVLRLVVPEESEGERLDKIVTSHLADTSRSFVQRLIDAGDVLVNDEPRRSSYKVERGDAIEVRVPPPAEPEEITPADILIPIAYEDEDIIVFDKPPDLVTHPAPGHEHGTLVNAFKWLRPDSIDPTSKRPGIVHRLDRDTSGLIVVAKTERARLHLVRQWQSHEVLKEYTALVVGHLDEDNVLVDAPIGRDPKNRKRMAVVRGGRPARSHLRTLERLPGYSLLDVMIETGRTHQIRVHCAFVKHPVAGDKIYGGYRQNFPLERQFLHARRLKFELPDGRPIDLQSPLPDDLSVPLEDLRARA